MATGNFFGGQFFGGGFFGAITPEETTTTGGKGDNKRPVLHTVKPTGLIDRPKLKAKDARVQDRLNDAAALEAEVAGKLAREFGEESDRLKESEQAQDIVQMSMAEVDREIAILLRKKMRTEEEEVVLLLLMVAASA